MAAATSKAHQRQHTKHAAYYKSQFDKTPINKIIKMARHIFRFKDSKTLDRLKQRPAIDRERALTRLKHDGNDNRNLKATLLLAG